MKAPLKIGITGGIGTGKTTVTKIFTLLGVPCYYADDRAKVILATDPVVREKVTEAFGTDVYGPQGPDRKLLASRVFNDEAKTALLNSIIHPRVGEDFENWLLSWSHAPYILKEAALLFEAGSYKSLDKIITVFAPAEIRIKRIKQRDPQRSEEEIKGIIARQWPEEQKLEMADMIIYNDNVHPVIPQVIEIHEKLIAIAEGLKLKA